MDSKVTDNSNEKKQVPEGWSPVSMTEKTDSPKQTGESMGRQLKGFLREDIPGEPDTITKGIKEIVDTVDTKQTVQTNTEEFTGSTVSKRISSRQRKESLDEYRGTFLSVPKLEDRKPVFVSCGVRDKLDEIARKLGGRRMSVSGFIENLARHHLEIYQDDIELWKKL